jgi:hypothetical protein
VDEEPSVIQIDADMTARQEPGRDAWEILDSPISIGRVVKTPSGFHALKSGPTGHYSVGTFITLGSAAQALRYLGLESD